MKKIKVIFLDIDGVMKSTASTIRNGVDMMHPEHVEALNYIIEKTDAKIVVTSTYRMMYSVKELKELFEEFGISGEHVISKTVTIAKNGYLRGHEIQQWLDGFTDSIKTRFNKNMMVDKYVILDDDTDMLPEQRMSFVKTSNNYGLTHLEALQAVHKLNGVPKAKLKIPSIFRQIKEHKLKGI